MQKRRSSKMLILYPMFIFISVLNVLNCLEDVEVLEDYFRFTNFPRYLHLRNLKKQCSTETLQRMRKLFEEDTCQPRLTMVEVSDPDPHVIKILPQNVLTPRCAGGETNVQHGCLPVETKLRAIPVVKVTMNYTLGQYEHECSTTEIQEHVSCKTGCKLTAKDCTAKQMFLENKCRCICSNDDERLKCENNEKMWIEVMCSCQCLPSSNIECSTGLMFDTETCRCVPVDTAGNISYLKKMFKDRENSQS